MRTPALKVGEVLVITDNPELSQRALSELKDFNVRVCRFQQLGRVRPTSQNYLLFIDARSLSEEQRQDCYRIGQPQQRIAIGDPTYDNRLAKTFITSERNLREALESAIERLFPPPLRRKVDLLV